MTKTCSAFTWQPADGHCKHQHGTNATITLVGIETGEDKIPRATLQTALQPGTLVKLRTQALVDTAFTVVRRKYRLTVNKEQQLVVELVPETRYIQFRLSFKSDGKGIVVKLSSPESTEPIWADKQLELRAALLRLNRFAIDTSGLDHEDDGAKEQIGPCKSARAIAIVQLAVYEALNSILHVTKSQFNVKKQPRTASVEAAIAQAAHDTLLWLYPKQALRFELELKSNLATVCDGHAKNQGIVAGKLAARALIEARTDDGSQFSTPEELYVDFRQRVYGVDNDNDIPLPFWRQDPIAKQPIAMGSRWNLVKPFAIESATQFRLPPPPEWTGAQFALEMNEVKCMGGDVVHTPTVRSEEDTIIGNFFAYDGTPTLCAPSRLYFQITCQLATENGVNTLDFARLLAVIGAAMADAALSSWDSKYHWKLHRPVTGLRQTTQQENPHYIADPTFWPLGAPASNTPDSPNFTPPFPSYSSGHATFGGTVFQTLRHFLGSNDIPFTFVSDEYDGKTKDNHGIVRPLIPRTFKTLSQAEEENGQSRIYLGIHWSIDKNEGIVQGQKVADWVFEHWYIPFVK